MGADPYFPHADGHAPTRSVPAVPPADAAPADAGNDT
jgi:hypothetical protein